MKHLLAVLATVALASTMVAFAEPAQAATPVSIKTIPTKTVPQGQTIRITPAITTRGKVKVSSTRMAVLRGKTRLARSVKSIVLPAGSYRVTISTKYRVKKSNGKYGRTRTALKSQALSIVTATVPAAPVPAAPVPAAPVPAAPVPVVPVPAPAAETVVQAAPATPCGTLTDRKPDGTAWTCTFSDEFTGTTLNTNKWRVQLTANDGVHTGPECWVDTPNNIAVADGSLQLTAREETAPFACQSPYGAYTTTYSGASVNTWGHFSQTYGRFEFRAKFPDTKIAGIHSALWLYPQSTAEYGSQDHASGEIDVAEFYSVYPDRAIPYLHYPSAPGNGNPATAWYCMIDPATYHTFTAEWTPTSIKISYDGFLCLYQALSTPAPFNRPFIAALTQTLGVTGTANQFTPNTTPLPATMKVDYVRVWR